MSFVFVPSHRSDVPSKKFDKIAFPMSVHKLKSLNEKFEVLVGWKISFESFAASRS